MCRTSNILCCWDELLIHCTPTLELDPARLAVMTNVCTPDRGKLFCISNQMLVYLGKVHEN